MTRLRALLLLVLATLTTILLSTTAAAQPFAAQIQAALRRAGISAPGVFVGSSVTVTQGTITAAATPMVLTSTWNNGAVTFTGQQIRITDTASAAASRVFEVLGGAAGTTELFYVRRDGTIFAPTSSFVSSGGGFQSADGGNYRWGAARQIMNSPADGVWNMTSSAGTVGVQLNTGTAAPTVSTCGTGTIEAGSRNIGGVVTATGATDCTVTFGAPAWTNVPFCVPISNTAGRAYFVSARSTTAFTVSGLTAGDVFTYICTGRV